jgi:hypothetical protein
MAGKASDHLHRLIRSMNSAEKRYFKLRTSGAGRTEGHQHLLFDAIAAMESYDEATLLQRFQGRAFTWRFAITKHRLYESVLDALEAFHAERSVDARLYRGLLQVDLLHKRGLHAEARKLLHGVRRLAEEHHRHAVLLDVLRLEQRAAEHRQYAATDADELERLRSTAERLREDLHELDTLWHLKSQVMIAQYRAPRPGDAETGHRLRTLLDHPLLNDTDKVRTAKGRSLVHHIRAAAAFALGDLDQCLLHLEANHAMLHSEPVLFSDEPDLVLTILGNLAYVQQRTGRTGAAALTLNELRNAPATWRMPESEELDVKLFGISASLELSLHIQSGQYAKALDVLPFVRRGVERFGEHLGDLRRAGLLYWIALVRFATGDHAAAHHELNDLLNGLRPGQAPAVHLAARVLQLFTYFELGKTDLLRYTLRNFERLLNKTQGPAPLERFCARLITDLLDRSTLGRGGEDARVVLGNAAEALRAMEEELEARASLDHFDVGAWIEAKLQQRPMASVLHERLAKWGRAA